MTMPVLLGDTLADEIREMLELIALGGIPNPQRAADLLRRLIEARARGAPTGGPRGRHRQV